MKKLLALTLAIILLAFTLAACGEKESNPSGNGTSDPGTSQQTPSSSDIYDIADTDIRAYASDLTTMLTGDEAATVKAKIPAEIKKGIGELANDLCTIGPSTSGSGYTFGVIFFVPKGSAVDCYTKLTDYYKTLEGTVTDETVIGEHRFFEMEFSWGKIYQCELGEYNEDNESISVGFTINE